MVAAIVCMCWFTFLAHLFQMKMMMQPTHFHGSHNNFSALPFWPPARWRKPTD
jgi:hypothetical protein